jgi:hypothetical protein
MRYVLMLLGAIGLGLGLVMFVNARNPEHISQATVVVQLGGVFLAIGMATADIVETIKSRLNR